MTLAPSPTERQEQQATRKAQQAIVSAAVQSGDVQAVLRTRNLERGLISGTLLRQAAQTGRADLTRALVEVTKSSVQRSALHAAIRVGDRKEVLTLVPVCDSRAQVGAMKLLGQKPVSDWLVQLTPLVSLKARRAGLLKAAKFRHWPECQVLMDACDLAGAPEQVTGDFLSDCVFAGAPQALVDQALKSATSVNRQQAMTAAAQTGQIGLMRQILDSMPSPPQDDWLSKAAASACAARQSASVAWLLEHTDAEVVRKKLDSYLKRDLAPLDLLGSLAPAEIQATWLAEFPTGLPLTAQVYATHRRMTRAGTLAQHEEEPRPQRPRMRA